jgi:hypothetical protein
MFLEIGMEQIQYQVLRPHLLNAHVALIRPERVDGLGNLKHVEETRTPCH